MLFSPFLINKMFKNKNGQWRNNSIKGRTDIGLLNRKSANFLSIAINLVTCSSYDMIRQMQENIIRLDQSM